MSSVPANPSITDTLERPLRSLRVSVTDRCNLRCLYCMPERDYVWLARADVLDFEEIARLAGVFTTLGVDKVRLTGGEPLMRRDLDRLVRLLCEHPGITDLAMTTNGLLLADQAAPLAAAGLGRVSVSLDTLRPDRFERLAQRAGLDDVIAGIRAARAAGLGDLKIDMVVMRGLNDDELVEMLAFGREIDAEVRFIEYMDVGGATRWMQNTVVSRDEILERITAQCGSVVAVEQTTVAPADRFRLRDGTVFGIIGSTTAPFCRTCDRCRLTADGQLFLCLYADDGIDLRSPLRDRASDAELRQLIGSEWRKRSERGAEIRLEQAERGTLHDLSRLREDPHLEMHTRGG
jgi:cyclic pyranopterin phosphate synthase